MSEKDIARYASYVEEGITSGIYPKFLYKFRSLDDTGKKRTLDIFKNCQLWFNKAENFNDPFDLNPVIDFTPKIELIVQWLISEGLNEPEAIERAQSIDREFMRQAIKKINNESLGICCFSENPSSILEWSHYSSFHTGICLKFSLLQDPQFFTFIQKVQYTNKQTIYDHFAANNSESIYNMLTNKYIDWSYEKEWRIFKPLSEKGIFHASGLYDFKPECLKEIIFGVKISSSHINEIIQECQVRLKHVKFSKAVLHEGVDFKLDFNPL